MSLLSNMNVETLIKYLKNLDLNLDEEDFNVLRVQKIDGYAFGSMTEEKFIADGMKHGPAIKLAIQASQFSNLLGRTSYFYEIPSHLWSLFHFQTWSRQLWPTTDQEEDRKIFYRVLYNFRDDLQVSSEVRDVVLNLLKQKKKVSIIIKI
jgi:hypothetical protein